MQAFLHWSLFVECLSHQASDVAAQRLDEVSIIPVAMWFIAMCCLNNSHVNELGCWCHVVVSFICEAICTSMCLPSLWAHQPRQTVWQPNMNGLAIPSCIRIASLGRESCGLFSITRIQHPWQGVTRIQHPWQGVLAAATTNTLGMRSFEQRRLLLHANPLRHCIPAYLQ